MRRMSVTWGLDETSAWLVVPLGSAGLGDVLLIELESLILAQNERWRQA